MMMKRGFTVLLVLALVGLGLWFFAGVSPLMERIEDQLPKGSTSTETRND